MHALKPLTLVVCPRLIYGEWWIHMKRQAAGFPIEDRVGPFTWAEVQIESERLIGLGHVREQ
jgi:hypothetical protein